MRNAHFYLVYLDAILDSGKERGGVNQLPILLLPILCFSIKRIPVTDKILYKIFNKTTTKFTKE